MRLICPNCDAEYEVDEAAIPEEGRDVLCSACGHSWFQQSPGRLAEKEDEAALFDAPSFDQSLVAPPEKEKEGVPESGKEGEPGHPGDAPPSESTVPEGQPAVRPISGRSLDESLMAVLREEAARETEARREESAGLETQTEMPLAGSTSAAAVLPSDDGTFAETVQEPAIGNVPEAMPGIDAGTSAEAAAESEPEIAGETAAGTPGTADEGAAESAAELAAGEAADAGADEAAGSAAGAPVEPAAEFESGAETGEKPPTGPEPETEPGPATAAMRKIAELRGKAEPPAAPPEAAAAGPESGAEGEQGPARRELLPEIEEINSTLRDASETREVDEGAVAHTIEEGPRGGGFRDGFLAVMVLVILGGALYLAAPFVATRVPALQPALMGYVHAVDGLRIGLDALVQGLSNWVSGLTGSKG